MYLAEMSLTTSEKLSQTREMYPPRIIEFMDIGANAILTVNIIIINNEI